VSEVTAYVGLGSNLGGTLGEPRAQILAALEELARLPRTRLVAHSSLYRSAPLGHAAQPDFLNAVARLETGLAAEELLGELQAIERRHGRERPFPGAPRTLDLDLLLYGDATIDSPRLTVPHPRMHERAFVLAPLLELESEAVIPGRGRAAQLLAACAAQRIART
jgi:2-amino-4-hydroxy-6-hydroxymethyldihydropteridine diphosphokinase